METVIIAGDQSSPLKQDSKGKLITTSDYDSEVTSLSASQTLTGSFADFGPPIDCQGVEDLSINLDIDANSSEDVQLRMLKKTSKTATEGYEITDTPTLKGTVTLWSGTSSDFKKSLEADVKTCIYVQFQLKAGTVGGTPAVISGTFNKA